MDKAQLKFINDIVKPWEELNNFLVLPYAVEPDLSDITLKAGNIANCLSHYPENIGQKRLKIPRLSIINDISDSLKHHTLDKPERQCRLIVRPIFECNDANQFRFLRNMIFVNHATFGEQDFMAFTLEVINYWLKELKINLALVIKENNTDFNEIARLEYKPEFCIHMEAVELKFMKRSMQQELVPYDPPACRFEIM